MGAAAAFRKVVGRAARGPLNLAVLGGGVLGAVALGMWPLAALGGAAYVALVATDTTNLNFRRRVLFGRRDPASLPKLADVADADVRAAIGAVLAARAEVDAVIKATPDRVRRHVAAALGSIAELEGHGATLAARADALSRFLASVDRPAAEAELARLEGQAAAATDPTARRAYEAASSTAGDRLTALRDIAAGRERALAHLTGIAAAMRAVPTKLVRLRVLDDQASDALTSDVGAELERMNIDLRAFEHTLQALVEVPS